MSRLAGTGFAAALCSTLAMGVALAPAAQARPAEPIAIRELPLPPTAPSSAPGSCTVKVNPHGTGCISASDRGIQEGPSYVDDGRHVLLNINFAGAAAGSPYAGPQVIAIRTDGTRFANGDAWKCITCGVPEGNAVGINTFVPKGQAADDSTPKQPVAVFDHPQPMPGGRRALAGTNILDCGTLRITDEACTPAKLRIYPIKWTNNMRELRLHPDGIHLGWSTFIVDHGVDEAGLYGRLVFKADGTQRYELEHVQVLHNNGPDYQEFVVDPAHPGQILHNKAKGRIGEFRGFSGDGKYALGMGWEESGNADLFMTSLQDGQSTRITSDPSYTDPARMSHDNKWLVYMNPRQSDRHMYYAGMRGLPPLVDMMILPIEVCCYNNGNRRFFQPYLVPVTPGHVEEPGQRINAGNGAPGSPSDLNWNGRADPTWSPDGTKIIYWQALVTAPACGGANPLPCPESTEPGGRRTRLMMAALTARKPVPYKAVPPAPDIVPWAMPMNADGSFPPRSRGGRIPPGHYVLKGKVSGQADVEYKAAGISVVYTNFSDDGRHIINGTESAERNMQTRKTVLHANLKATGAQNATKVTSEPDGFELGDFSMSGMLPPKGTLTTTIDGKSYGPLQPGT